jgi:hypothetical protein
MTDEKKKVDEAWKEKAEQEKQKAAEAGPDPAPETPDAEPKAAGAARPPLPEASFGALISSLAAQALVGLGQVPDPASKKPVVDLEAAKFTIDLIQVLSDKTKGNLEPDEQRQIDGLLYDLRMRYVQCAG